MLALAVDELTVVLLVVAVLLTVAHTLRTTHGDAPAAVLAHQASVGRARMPGETAVHRARSTPAGMPLTRWLHDDVRTVHQGFQRGLRIARDRPCLGVRAAPRGPYTWHTYAQVQVLVDQFGSGLQALGVAAGQTTHVGLFAPNRLEWLVADLVRAPPHPALSPQRIRHPQLLRARWCVWVGFCVRMFVCVCVSVCVCMFACLSLSLCVCVRGGGACRRVAHIAW
jgi:hypothetical protein